jgi:hypothetical protein
MSISIYKLNAAGKEMPAFMLSFPLFDPGYLYAVAPGMYCTQCCGAGAEIKSGAGIMICGSGSASFLFIKEKNRCCRSFCKMFQLKPIRIKHASVHEKYFNVSYY